MKFYVVIEAKPGLSKKALQNAVNAKNFAVACKNAENAQETVARLANSVEEGKKLYILDADFAGNPKKGELEAFKHRIALPGTVKVYPQVRQVTVNGELVAEQKTLQTIEIEAGNESDIESDNGLDNEAPKVVTPPVVAETVQPPKETEENKTEEKPEEDSEEYSIWAKLGFGTVATAAASLALYAGNVIPATTIASFSASVGLSAVAATTLAYGIAGIALAGALTLGYLAVKAVVNYFTAEEVLTEAEYKKFIPEETKVVNDLEAKLKTKNAAALQAKFTQLLEAAPDKTFKDGEPVAVKGQSVTKDVVLKWQHSKLAKLVAIKDSKEQEQYEEKIMQKADVKCK